MIRAALLARMREPSTWAGLGLVVTNAATAYATRDPVAIGALVAGLVSIARPEGRGRG